MKFRLNRSSIRNKKSSRNEIKLDRKNHIYNRFRGRPQVLSRTFALYEYALNEEMLKNVHATYFQSWNQSFHCRQ